MSYYDDVYEYATDNYGLITSRDACSIGVSNVELVKLAHRGRLNRLGHGVYRLTRYVPTPLDKYADAVTLVGCGAYVFGESVLAMHGLAFVNPPVINIAIASRVRKKLPSYIRCIFIESSADEIVYHEGIPAQSVFGAILACKATLMKERLENAIVDAKRQGLISESESRLVRKEIR